MSSVAALPDPRVCERARLSRDPRFDGLFFTAVRSTGIYCRPVCPAPPPLPANVDYYPSAAAAEAAGFRPCLRCRPELAPEDGAWRRGDALVARALALIEQGFLAEHPVAALAERLAVGERQLRRLFVQRLGAAPLGVHVTRRLLFAKQLLTETTLPVTEVALAAGFGSLRRFNAAFQEAYRMAPRELRRSLQQRPALAADRSLVLRLGYRPPYDFAAILDFLRDRALPGVERVDGQSYARVVGDASAPAWLRVSHWPSARARPVHALRLELHGVAPARLADTVQRVRRMFDLDADPNAIAAVLGADPRLRPLLRQRPGLRLPSGWDGLEIAARAVIGQQVSVAAARTLAARLVQRHGAQVALDAAPGLDRLFPDAATLAAADLDGLGLTGARIASLRAIARAVLEGKVGFGPEQTLEEFVEAWCALPGIGPWTAQYLALRALGHPDAFPAEDLVLQKAASGDGTRLSTRQLRERAQAWRPWRAYAVIHLWREAALPASRAGTEAEVIP
ncbi:DNA-3-methyladenine glycosylase 2 family protein [Pseudoxanthomonas sp. SGNA-20]|jgi:3-methyladenine DNA glycosylase/8-oxoguanine DNA glycosylase|uniref:DNA-3-methyladenine glycosylase 2 family protein n=1 Tax=unclassified Pseudoxanthomonas TaxID=2645906 RepID=UPI000F62B31B|nr:MULTISPECIES: AlkA N-terminal domain-containing protein [unclassified Pseudoxanthomonas]RRN55980.1 DNA-3-methyladenine glycosylase 2 family protein [Pseudoxanthomonas sp. SGNA-20]RRN79254.1 DNA-3-methyladenine glycosylase 2 family protein [Pseudoxanthomonas sp. SGD-10]